MTTTRVLQPSKESHEDVRGRMVRFSKFTSFGNTFIIVDETDDPFEDDDQRAAFSRWALNGDFGIGGTDNVLYLRAARDDDRSADGEQADYLFRVFEVDGAETLSCGNGLLSTGGFLHRSTGGSRWRVLTELPSGRPKLVEVSADAGAGSTSVSVGWPRPTAPELYRRDGDEPRSAIDEVPPLRIPLPPGEDWAAGLGDAVTLNGLLTFTGEPHISLFEGSGFPPELSKALWVDTDGDSDSRIGLPETPEMVASRRLVHHLGMYVDQHHRDIFPQGVHLNFARLRGDAVIEYRTWERAINCETLACGSGTVAMAHAGRTYGLFDGSELEFWPHACRWYKPDAALTVRETPDGFVLSGRPQLVCEGAAPRSPMASLTSPGF